MSYRILARKYRPRTFAEVIGQDHIVTALSRAIEKERLGQAYMLVGPRGTGKTSTARILAKTLNCEKGMSITPCLECDACREIEGGHDSDVVEIDGASNNGVDDVRALRERVHYRPLRDRHKIYIIDEVQRLSGPAFDALLKTLEEPPDHALFLFATTDPHKIPDTIVSRCQVFEFRRLREVDIQAKLTSICEWEKQQVPAEVIAAISRGCRGGLRDAESMLDQVLAVADGAPTLDDLEMIAGLARPERWLGLFEAVAADDGGVVLQNVEDFLQRGGSERDFVQQAVDALRDLLHLVLLGADALGVEPEPERRQRSMELAKVLGRDRLEAMLGMMFALEGRMAKAPLAARALLEWTLLRAARLQVLLQTEAVLADVQAGRAPAAVPVGGISVQAAPSMAPSSARMVATPAAPPVSQPPPVTPPESPAPYGNDAAQDAMQGAAVTAAPATQVATPAPSGQVTFRQLMDAFQAGRPTAARIVEENLIDKRVHADHVEVILQPLEPKPQALIEDPVLQKFLARLEGTPGPWKISYQQTEIIADPVGDRLRGGFDTLEELP
jgi:DNA polymerase III subunit gamma/tau